MCFHCGAGFGIATGKRNGQYSACKFLSDVVICSSDAMTSWRIGVRKLDGGRQAPERLSLICRRKDCIRKTRRYQVSGDQRQRKGCKILKSTIRDKEGKVFFLQNSQSSFALGQCRAKGHLEIFTACRLAS
jgi:hypothetical protein